VPALGRGAAIDHHPALGLAQGQPSVGDRGGECGRKVRSEGVEAVAVLIEFSGLSRAGIPGQ